MSGKLSRDKGARIERDVAKLFKQELGWATVKRHLSQYQIPSGRDLDGTQPFCIQVKGGKRPNVETALAEATSATGTEACYSWPVAFTKADGEPYFTVSMPHWVFFDMCKMAGMKEYDDEPRKDTEIPAENGSE